MPVNLENSAVATGLEMVKLILESIPLPILQHLFGKNFLANVTL